MLALAALYGLGVRYFVAQLPELKSEVVSQLEDALGNQIKVGKIETGWHKLSPWIRLYDFQVVTASGLPAVDVKLIEFSLNLSVLILNREVAAKLLRVKGGDLQLVQYENGSLGLKGGQGGADIDLEPLVDFVLGTEAWHFNDIRLRFESALPRLAGRPFDLDLDIRASKQGTWTNLLAGMRAYGADRKIRSPLEAEISGRFRGNPKKIKKLQLDAHLVARSVDMLQWVHPFQIGSNKLTAASDQLSATIQLRPEYRMEARISTENFTGVMSNQAGQDLLIKADLAQFSIQGKSKDGWHAQAKINKGHIGDLPLSGLTASAEVGFHKEGSNYWIHSPKLDTRHINRLLLFNQDISAQIQRWITQTNPVASIQNAYAQIQHTSGRPFSLATQAQVSNLKLESFNAIPYLESANGRLLAFERGASFKLDASPFKIAFPALFAPTIQVDKSEIDLLFSFSPGSFFVKSDRLSVQSNYGSLYGNFAASNPAQPYLRTASAQLAFKDVQMDKGLELLPVTLPTDLQDWIRESFSGGEVINGGMIYHAHLAKVNEPVDLSSLGLIIDLQGTEVNYDPEWPQIEDVSGRLFLTEQDVWAFLPKSKSFGIDLSHTVITIPVVEGFSQPVKITGVVKGSLERIFEFVKQTPTQEFVDPEILLWKVKGQGRFDMSLDMVLNLSGNADGVDDATVMLDGQVSTAHLDLVQSQLVFNNGEGHLRIHSELGVLSEGIEFDIFGSRSFGKIHSDWSNEEQTKIYANLTGKISNQPLAEWLEVPAMQLLSGQFEYQGKAEIISAKGTSIKMSLTSDLVGLNSPLPPPFTKPVHASRPSKVSFFVDEQDTSLIDFELSGGIVGRLELAQGELTRGVLRLNDSTPLKMPENPVGIKIFGQIKTTDIGDWLDYIDAVDAAYAQHSPDGETEAPNVVNSIEVRGDHVTLGEFDIYDFLLHMRRSEDERWDGRVISNEVGGTFQIYDDDDRPMIADLKWVRINYEEELGQEAEAHPESLIDPLGEVDFADLIPTQFDIGLLEIDREDYGAWSFFLQPEESKVVMTDFGAKIRGLLVGNKSQLAPDKPDPQGQVIWKRDSSGDTTYYTGSVSSSDLGEVLTAWEYPKALQTRQAEIDLGLEWPGSPAMFDWLTLKGDAGLIFQRGGFSTVDKGTSDITRLISLLDASFWIRRLFLDFSDLQVEGIAFDRVYGKAEFDTGLVRIDEPLHMIGPGADLAFSGQANILDNTVEGELIATLPVSKNLPWLAAYLALASNPITGALTFLAERIFRKGINRLTSAKYLVSGELSSPDIKFSQAFNVSTGDKAKNGKKDLNDITNQPEN